MIKRLNAPGVSSCGESGTIILAPELLSNNEPIEPGFNTVQAIVRSMDAQTGTRHPPSTVRNRLEALSRTGVYEERAFVVRGRKVLMYRARINAENPPRSAAGRKRLPH
jgi:hypothetical protein